MEALFAEVTKADHLEATPAVCVLMARGYANLGAVEPVHRYRAAPANARTADPNDL